MKSWRPFAFKSKVESKRLWEATRPGGGQTGEVQVEPRHLEALLLKSLLGSLFSLSFGNKEVNVLLFLENA